MNATETNQWDRIYALIEETARQTPWPMELLDGNRLLVRGKRVFLHRAGPLNSSRDWFDMFEIPGDCAYVAVFHHLSLGIEGSLSNTRVRIPNFYARIGHVSDLKPAKHRAMMWQELPYLFNAINLDRVAQGLDLVEYNPLTQWAIERGLFTIQEKRNDVTGYPSARDERVGEIYNSSRGVETIG